MLFLPESCLLVQTVLTKARLFTLPPFSPILWCRKETNQL